jgi:hypothetical protein
MGAHELDAMSEALGDLGVKDLTELVELDDGDIVALVRAGAAHDTALADMFESCIRELQDNGGDGE